MPGPWYLAADLQTDVLNILKTSTLEAYWLDMTAKAANTAYSDITEILLGKGYTIAQLDQWDNRAVYSRQQALFWLFTETELGINWDDKEVAKLDRRKSLQDSSTIMINGIPVAPAGDDTAGGVSGGFISEDGYRINGCTEF